MNVIENPAGAAVTAKGSTTGVPYVTPNAGTLSALTALSDGAVLSASPVRYESVVVNLDAGAVGWVQLHDASSAPADGAVPKASIYAIGPCIVRFGPWSPTTGAYWCLSSTMRTKTITAFTLACASTEA